MGGGGGGWGVGWESGWGERMEGDGWGGHGVGGGRRGVWGIEMGVSMVMGRVPGGDLRAGEGERGGWWGSARGACWGSGCDTGGWLVERCMEG